MCLLIIAIYVWDAIDWLTNAIIRQMIIFINCVDIHRFFYADRPTRILSFCTLIVINLILIIFYFLITYFYLRWYIGMRYSGISFLHFFVTKVGMFDSDSILEKIVSFGLRIGFFNRIFAIRFSWESILYPKNQNRKGPPIKRFPILKVMIFF